MCLNFEINEIHFLEFPWKIVFGVTSGKYLYIQLFKNAKKDCPLQSEIARFPIEFRLNLLLCAEFKWSFQPTSLVV